jgi:UDP:flavonoid glycosyltransferase YjiC (YdhE family)
VLEDEPVAVPTQLPWPAEDPTSLVLMSFSTGFEQRSVAKLQAGLDALATLPVHVVATTGGIVEPQELAVPANAVVLRYAAHDPILRRAALAVTHGGHGTMMRALRHGVPLVVIPGLAHDQAPNAATAEDWRVGLALPGDADAAAIRAAADTILGEPGYRQAAARRATALAGIDGAANAADEVEALLSAEATGAGLDRAAPAGGRPPRAAAAR